MRIIYNGINIILFLLIGTVLKLDFASFLTFRA